MVPLPLIKFPLSITFFFLATAGLEVWGAGEKVEKFRPVVEKIDEANKTMPVMGGQSGNCPGRVSPNNILERDLLKRVLQKDRTFFEEHFCEVVTLNLASFQEKCKSLKNKVQSFLPDFVNDMVECIDTPVKEGSQFRRIKLKGDMILLRFLFPGEKNCYNHTGDIFSKEKFDSEVKALLNEADFYFQQYPELQETAAQLGKRDLKVDPEKTPRRILEQLLKNHHDVVIGEKHHDLAPKRAIIDNMDVIAEAGAVIAIEHIFHHPYQALLDKFMADEEGNIDPRLQIYLNSLDKIHGTKSGYGFTDLVAKAWEHQVRIVAFDTETSYRAGMGGGFGGAAGGADRYKAMNFMNKLVVDEERQGRKVVHFVGSAHTNTRMGVPGVAELMGGAPSLVIEDSPSSQKERKVELGVDRGKDGVRADVLITVPMENK